MKNWEGGARAAAGGGVGEKCNTLGSKMIP